MMSHAPVLRSYAHNSAEAAGRILALALIANGQVKRVETAVLDTLEAHQRLGLTRPQWHAVVQQLCADLLGPARLGIESCINGELLDQMLDEVDDDGKRRLVLHLCAAVALADAQIVPAEEVVLLGLVERWGLHPDDQPLVEPLLYGAHFQVRSRSVIVDVGVALDVTHKLGTR